MILVGKTVAAVIGVVVAVAIAVAAPYLAPAFLAAIGTTTATALATAAATALIGATLGLGVMLGMKALGLSPSSGVPKAAAMGAPQIIRQSITDSFIIYGKVRTAFLKMVFFHPRQSGDDHFRYFVYAVAGHRCQGVTQWYLNDEQVTVDGSNMVTTGKYANAAWLWFQRGLASETANATFVSECGGLWTNDHKGNGIAAIYAKFQLTDEVVEAGFPTPSAVIEGKDDIYDPRTETSGYENNAALVFYDWMKIPREEGGFGAYDDEIPDDDYISAQANVCDESVGGEARYALDGVIITGASPSEIRETLMINCAGSFTYSGGKFLMRPGYFVPVSVSLSEGDLTGPITVNAFTSGDQAANEVSGTFVDPASDYKGEPFTTQTLPGATDIRQIGLDLAYITSKRRAERVASIMLKRAAAEKSVSWPMNIMGLGVQALDTVQLNTSRYGLSNYAFQVRNWGLSADFSVVLSLGEENEEIYEPPEYVEPEVPPTIVVPLPLPIVATSAATAATADTALLLGGTWDATDIADLEARIAALETP